jgi:hypothetical protein
MQQQQMGADMDDAEYGEEEYEDDDGMIEMDEEQQ